MSLDIAKSSIAFWTTDQSIEYQISSNLIAKVSPRDKAIIKADVNGAITGAASGAMGGFAFAGLGAVPGALFGGCMGGALSSAGEGLWQSIGY